MAVVLHAPTAEKDSDGYIVRFVVGGPPRRRYNPTTKQTDLWIRGSFHKLGDQLKCAEVARAMQSVERRQRELGSSCDAAFGSSW